MKLIHMINVTYVRTINVIKGKKIVNTGAEMTEAILDSHRRCVHGNKIIGGSKKNKK